MKKISINKDIHLAKTLPSFFYLDNDYYQLSIKKIFESSWQIITDINSFKNNIYPFTFLEDSIDEPLLLTKNNNEIISLSNVCTHRGNILCEDSKSLKNILCKYHGRVFNFSGELISAPGFENVKNFPTKKDNLYQSKIKIWKNFILTSLSPKINLQEIFKDIEDRLNLYPFEKIKYDEESSKTYYIDAHWALYCENYLEGFHVPFIHHGLNRDIALNTYKTILLKNGVLQYTLSKSNEKKIGIPSKYLNSDENIYAYYYWLFPNMMLNFYSWGISINIIEPISKNKTRIKFLSYPIDNNIQPVKLDSSLDKVEKEDQAVVLNVQKGIASKFYNRGRYSSKHEMGVHHFHRLLCNYLN